MRYFVTHKDIAKYIMPMLSVDSSTHIDMLYEIRNFIYVYLFHW